LGAPRSLRRAHYIAAILLATMLLAGGAVVHSLYGYTHSDLSGHAWGSDDAYISYRYARNLTEGHGLVFNPGERVEGYSNFLYLILIAFGYVSGLRDRAIYAYATLLNLVLMLGSLLIFARFVRRKLGEPRAAAAALLFALTPTVWVWVASGMETALVVLLQVALFISVERVAERETRADIGLCAGIMIVLILARADGFVAPLLGVAYLLLRRKKRAAVATAAAVVFSLGAYVLWRVAYYGYPFPNTFYVKVSDTLAHRLLYAAVELARLSIDDGFLLYLAAISLGVYRFVRDGLRRGPLAFDGLSFATFFSVGWLGYWLYIGGDYFDERFLLILVPLALYNLMQVVGEARPRAFVFPVIIIAVLGLSPLALDPRFEYSRVKYDRWVTLGMYLKENHSDQTLAIDAAGKVPFYSGLETIDILGLNDPVIAHEQSAYFLPGHNKFDPDYILSRQPDLIAAWMAPCDGDRCDRLDMILGLSEGKYVAAGYRIRYLLNTTRDSTGEDILDVSGMSRSDVIDRIFRGRGYGVLERIDRP
jgi:arabinofuranosyltransferase